MENLKVINVCSGSSVVMDDLNDNDDEKMIVMINQRGKGGFREKVSLVIMNSC